MGGKPFEVTAPDPYTVVIKTPSSNAALLRLRGSRCRSCRSTCSRARFRTATSRRPTTSARRPIRSSPAARGASQQYVPGEKTVLGRNPYWFGVDKQKQRLPYLDELVFLIVPDQDAADLKFRAGELDGLDDVKPENYRWYEDNQQKGNFTLHDLGPDMNTNFFWFNLNKVQQGRARARKSATRLSTR